MKTTMQIEHDVFDLHGNFLLEVAGCKPAARWPAFQPQDPGPGTLNRSLTPGRASVTLELMQSLNLTSEVRRSDGWLKSLFWPTVENAWDVNYLGQQGFWICMLLAVATLGMALLTGNGIAIVLGVVAAAAYVLGGMGVREKSWPAAALIFVTYSLNVLSTVALRQLPNVISIIFAAVLFSNLRAAFLASEWRPAGEGEDQPTRFNESLADKLVDQMPATFWPVLQIPFFVLGSLLLLVNLAGLGFVLAQRFGIWHPGPIGIR